PEVQKVVAERFDTPTPAEELAFPPIIEGKNVLLMAPTGSGKTEAVLVPLFDKLFKDKPKPIALLYITPLKSLNRDLLERVAWWAQRLDFGVTVRHGDTTQHERKVQLENPDEMFLTTAEQLQAMLVGERMKALLRNVKWVVIDEVHELVDSKRGVQLTVALERLRELCGDFQMICLSATVGNPEGVAQFMFGGRPHKIINTFTKKNLKVMVDAPFPKQEDKLMAEKLFIGDTVAARLRTIHDLIDEHKASLIFTNTREAAEILASRLKNMDTEMPLEVHHGSLSKEARIQTEKDFKAQKLKAILCTSSLQLGIDIGSVDLVVQYMSPREVSQFTQRLGRAGHSLEKVSKGIILAGDDDDIFEAAVIARKTLAGELEIPRLHDKSMDVLAHQIIGLAMSDYRIPIEKAYGIIRRAFPFRDMTSKEFFDMVQFLAGIHLLFVDNGLARKRRAFEYYFGGMSTIPDSHTYRVIDITANVPIGSLDEMFVAEHNESGSTFVIKGRPWRVVQIEKDKVYVEPASGLESAVPAWEGELIPVPFSIAQEVGVIRREVAGDLKTGKSATEVSNHLKMRYPLTSQAAARMVAYVKAQMKWPLPDDKHIIIETFGEFTVLHSPFGSLANETLARFISALLSAEQGRTIACKSDPYRIVFGSVLAKDIREVFEKYKPEDIRSVLTLALPNTSLFKHRFLQVGKRIGAIRKDADFSRVNIDRIVKAYENSPVSLETLNEIFTEKLDVEAAERMLEQIRSGKIKLTETKGLSPMAEAGLKYELHDVARPDRPEAEIQKVFRQRLLNTRIRLVCVNCGNYSIAMPVNDVDKEPRCPKCASKLLACVHPYMTEAPDIIKKRLKGKSLTDEEQKKLERIRRSADMMICYGRAGAVVLAGRGVGPQTAGRILARMHRNEDELYKDILAAERQFIATKKFWSD
ncbi:MAG: DEAD/DEAH box helicase, partial [Candidatus Aenigmatarchaeota archaeon]